MSTVCKLVIPAPADAVLASTRDYLAEEGMAFTVSETEWPAACEHTAFDIGDNFPSILSVKQVTLYYSEIHFNSFSKMSELASFLSRALHTKLVVNIYQSVSTASYWALHDQGRLVRAVEAGDGEVYAESGAKLPFEGEIPGGQRGSGNDTYWWFDHEDQDRYNREVGVRAHVYQQYDSGWTNVLRAMPARAAAPVTPPKKRPWWRFFGSRK